MQNFKNPSNNRTFSKDSKQSINKIDSKGFCTKKILDHYVQIF